MSATLVDPIRLPDVVSIECLLVQLGRAHHPNSIRIRVEPNGTSRIGTSAMTREVQTCWVEDNVFLIVLLADTPLSTAFEDHSGLCAGLSGSSSIPLI